MGLEGRGTKQEALEKLGGIKKGDVFFTERSTTPRLAHRVDEHGNVVVIEGKLEMLFDPRFIESVVRPDKEGGKPEEDTFILDD